MPLRLFIALPLPPSARAMLDTYQQSLREAVGDAVRWSPPEQWHLTLRFLGDVDERLVPDLLRLAERAGGVTPAVAARWLPVADAFPRWTMPQVVWVGLAEGGQAVARLAEMLERGVVGLGLPAEPRALHPHVTLGRVRSTAQARTIGEQLAGVPDRLGEAPFRLDTVACLRSTLTPRGPIHATLGAFPLAGAP